MSSGEGIRHWKLTIDPRGKTDHAADSLGFCRSRGLVGIGWDLGIGTIRSPDAASKKGAAVAFEAQEYGSGWKYVNAMVNRVRAGDIVWVYGDGGFHACQITGDWCHDGGGEWDRHDIHNFREASWRPVHNELVPGHLRRHSTLRGTIHEIGVSPLLAGYLEWLGTADIDIDSLKASFDVGPIAESLRACGDADIFEVLDPDDLEDVVCYYLQGRGWWLTKSSGYRAQRDFECSFQGEGDAQGRTAWLQVKSGKDESLDPSAYADCVGRDEHIFLFSSATPPYLCDAPAGVSLIDKGELAAFMCTNLARLPWHLRRRLARWSEAMRAR